MEMLSENGFWFGVIIFVFLIILVISKFTRKKDKWVSTESFEREKKKLHPHFSEEEYNNFMHFLNSYKGGFVRRKSGRIVYQDFLNKEKGDLKGIFYNLVVENPNISVTQKEEFRAFLISVGVNGVNERPEYETRDSRLRNKSSDENEYRRKEVGNIGEQIVRDELKKIEKYNYAVINGPVLKYNGTVKEFDHIVVGENGVFCIETKAFGMTEGESTHATIFIDKGDKWFIRKNKHNKELESPTEQIIEEKTLLENVIASSMLTVHPVLVLSNKDINVKNNIKLPYDIVRVDGLLDYISNYIDAVTENDKMFVLSDIDRCRIN